MNDTLTAIVEPQATVREHFGREYDINKLRNNPVFMEFQRQARRILYIANTYMLDPGEVLLYINRKYQLVWDTIPYCRYEEIKNDLRHNWFRLFETICPDYHRQLMKSENDYSRWHRYYDAHTSPKEAPIGSND
jgi:hypothetical protein